MIGAVGKHIAKITQGPVAKGAMGILSLRIVNTGLGFLTSLVLSRKLGAANYGAYTYAITLVSLLAVPAVLGLDSLIIRELATHQVRSQWGLMRGILRLSNMLAFLMACVLAGSTALGIWVFARDWDPQMAMAVWIALIALPVFALTRLRQAALRGLHRATASLFPELIVHRVVLVLLIGAVLFYRKEYLNSSLVVALYGAAAVVAFLVGARLLANAMPGAAKDAEPEYQTRQWRNSALSFVMISGMVVVNSYTDILMLGAMKGSGAAGIYSVANAYVQFIVFIYLAVNTPLYPRVAAFYAANEFERLRELVSKAARIVFFISLPISLLVVMFGYRLLLLFGPDFVQGETALAILIGGTLIAFGIGRLAGIMLTVAGHERYTASAVGVGALLNVVLNAILIPEWGMSGAAVATSISLIVWTIWLGWGAFSRVGFHATGLGIIRNHQINISDKKL